MLARGIGSDGATEQFICEGAKAKDAKWSEAQGREMHAACLGSFLSIYLAFFTLGGVAL
jgi:hypothetical protein